MKKLVSAGLAAALLVGAAGAAVAQPVVVERYGHWDRAWGAPPPGPPGRVAYWRHHRTNWYGHVHNCMGRYHGYDPRRDMYMQGHRWMRCTD
ncbi:MAG: hypothetical protein JWQ97_10 [Phenylobacterium sp.]|nr:hypothetical protein [Phenylobacterium sp.]